MTNAVYTKTWFAAHPGYAAAASRKYRAEHPDRLKKQDASYKKAWRMAHPGYDVAATIKWKKAHPEKSKEVATAATAKWRAANTAYVAPLSSTAYHRASREKAAGCKRQKRCKVCRRNGRRICFDHCHTSGKFRGWLCLQCNTILGHVGDSPKLLRKLADYLDLRDRISGGNKPKVCGVCHKTGRRICFDHCHKSNSFRGWLCHQCNVVLGLASDSSKVLRNLANYLEADKSGSAAL